MIEYRSPRGPHRRNHGRLLRRLLLVVLASAVGSVGLSARVTVKEEKPGPLKKAKITAEVAIASAQAKMPKGKLDAVEIEEEDAELIYTITFTTAGKTGVDEVNGDAMTGKVAKPEHESPADEAEEQAEDAKKAAAEKKQP